MEIKSKKQINETAKAAVEEYYTQYHTRMSVRNESFFCDLEKSLKSSGEFKNLNLSYTWTPNKNKTLDDSNGAEPARCIEVREGGYKPIDALLLLSEVTGLSLSRSSFMDSNYGTIGGKLLFTYESPNKVNIFDKRVEKHARKLEKELGEE